MIRRKLLKQLYMLRMLTTYQVLLLQFAYISGHYQETKLSHHPDQERQNSSIGYSHPLRYMSLHQLE